MPAADVSRLKLFEACPDGWATRPDGGGCQQPDTGRDTVLVEKREPGFPDELPVCEQTGDLPIWADRQKTRQQLFPQHLGTADAVRQHRPYQGQTEPAPYGEEHQGVDVLLAEFPVGAVKNQFEVAVGQDGQREPDEQPVWKLELDKATEPLVARIQRAWKVDMGFQGVQDNRAGLHHRQDECGQDGEVARVNGQGRRQGGLQAIVSESSLVCFHRGKHATGADFLFNSRVLIGSQCGNISLYRNNKSSGNCVAGLSTGVGGPMAHHALDPASYRKRALIARMILPLCLCLSVLLLMVYPAMAQVNGEDRDPPHCTPRAIISNSPPRLVGRPLSGTSIEIMSNARIIEYEEDCDITVHPLSSFEWRLVERPSTSSATLQPINMATTKLSLDRIGGYIVRFVACPSVCTHRIRTGRVVNLTSTEATLNLTAVKSLHLLPKTDPVLPPMVGTSRTDFPRSDTMCQGGGGFLDPQWVTTRQWRGAQDYELLEGLVLRSQISHSDNLLNHDTQDHNFYVRPDPPYLRLLSTEPEEGVEGGLGVEWERGHFPEAFRPTVGDRVSVFGYWILDCGHDGYTEIHPPVGTAVHRARAILVPQNQTFQFGTTLSKAGSNVYVPGIVSDIWFNRDSGEITNNCSDTGLHQPAQLVLIGGLCINGPSPINRRFEFRIYLPPDPYALLRQEGQIAPRIPLYFQAFKHPTTSLDGPDPVITPVRQGNITYLKVVIDLSNFGGKTYARRIESAWIYPSPDNWGLGRWKLRVDSLDVHDDGDGGLKGDGDWRFWVNTNNGGSEWAKLFDCSGCVTGHVTFGGRPSTLR